MCAPPDAVDLVDEEDAWRIGFCLCECSRHSPQHLAEITGLEPGYDGGREQSELQEVRQRSREGGLPRAWRTGEEQPRAHLRPVEAAFFPKCEISPQHPWEALPSQSVVLRELT